MAWQLVPVPICSAAGGRTMHTVSEGLRDGVVDSHSKVGVIPPTLEAFPGSFINQEQFLAQIHCRLFLPHLLPRISADPLDLWSTGQSPQFPGGLIILFLPAFVLAQFFLCLFHAFGSSR